MTFFRLNYIIILTNWLRKYGCDNLRIKYANSKVEKYFSDYEKMKRKIPFEWVKNVKKHIDRLKAAQFFGEFLELGLGHPEKLEGYNNRYSLRVSPNARLIIELDTDMESVIICDEVEVEGVCDYHGKKENWYIP